MSWQPLKHNHKLSNTLNPDTISFKKHARQPPLAGILAGESTTSESSNKLPAFTATTYRLHHKSPLYLFVTCSMFHK